ncbi:MAG TPA: sodium:proton antiporter [Gammaproteobacteria bacterium]|nr:sodium:proton antiporter [Gammaproteobacteria bacterium]
MEVTASPELAALATLAIVLGAGVVAASVAKRLGLPDIVLYLLAGVLLGPVLGWLDVAPGSTLNQFILTAGAAYILFDGGTTLRFRVLQEIWLLLVVLATIGVAITGAVVALAAHWLLGLPVLVAALLGATLASTDPATLVPVFRHVKVKERVAQLVMSESAMNDATGAILTFTVLALLEAASRGGGVSLSGALVELLIAAGVGLVTGAACGYAAAALVAGGRSPLPRELRGLITLLVVAGAYSLAVSFGGSGFMAVFTAGVMLMNYESFGHVLDGGERHQLELEIGNLSLLFRVLIFVLLGSQVDFALIERYLLPGMGIVAIFMLVARPATVFLCALVDRRAGWTRDELLFMSWTRETGVIPAALVGLLAGRGAPNIDAIGAVTFIAILATILIQASTTRWWAARLGLLEP